MYSIGYSILAVPYCSMKAGGFLAMPRSTTPTLSPRVPVVISVIMHLVSQYMAQAIYSAQEGINSQGNRIAL